MKIQYSSRIPKMKFIADLTIFLLWIIQVNAAVIEEATSCPKVACLPGSNLNGLDRIWYITARTTLVGPENLCDVNIVEHNQYEGYDFNVSSFPNSSWIENIKTLRLVGTNATDRSYDGYYTDTPNDVFKMCFVARKYGLNAEYLTDFFCTRTNETHTLSTAVIRSSLPCISHMDFKSLKQDYINKGVQASVVNQIEKRSFINCTYGSLSC